MEEEISIEDIISILKKKFGVIILWGLIAVLISGLYTFFLSTPMYESSSRIVVNQTQNNEQAITNADIQTNLNLINTYQSIIKEPIILEDVLSSSDGNMTINQLSDSITVQIQNNSLVFGISVTNENPYKAAELANAVATVFQDKIGNILEVQSVTILSIATPNLKAVSPNIFLNLILGLIVGLIVGLGLAFISEFRDKRVKDEKIIDEIGWINLGSVLEMSMDEVRNTRMNVARLQKEKSNQITKRRRV